MSRSNTTLIKDCYGCGVCALVCPKDLIRIDLNEEGFYSPSITNPNECKDCGMCLSVCAYRDQNVSVKQIEEPEYYAAWINDEGIRYKCSSGGIGFAFGEYLIQQGYKAIGVRYNADLIRAEHYLAISADDFMASIGSKYIPSYTLSGFSRINRTDKFFITGTPCQIDSLQPYPEINSIIHELQKKLDLHVIYLEGTFSDYRKKDATNIRGVGPCEFVKLFMDAKFVITTSLHGTAFALNFSVPLCAVIKNRSDGDSRIYDLLKSVGAENSAITIDSEDLAPSPMDYAAVNQN